MLLYSIAGRFAISIWAKYF